jgi:hypothetical protein
MRYVYQVWGRHKRIRPLRESTDKEDLRITASAITNSHRSASLASHCHCARRMNSGTCGPFSLSFVHSGRVTTSVCALISDAGTASSNAKRDTSACKSIFVLRGVVVSVEKSKRREAREGTYSSTAKRHPMHACGPAQNVSMLPHTPGTVPACASAFVSLAQRSGLHDDQRRASGMLRRRQRTSIRPRPRHTPPSGG